MRTINYIIVLIACSVFTITTNAQSCHSNSNTSSAHNHSQNENDKAITESFKVFGNCDMCKKRIEDAVNVKGVYSAEWNQKTKALTVSYNPDNITHTKINLLIVSAGHDTEEMRASDNLYNTLPMCCQYERNQVTSIK